MTAGFEHEVLTRLARIETKIDANTKTIADHEDRLRLTDRWRYGLSSGVAMSILGALAAFAKVAAH